VLALPYVRLDAALRPAGRGAPPGGTWRFPPSTTEWVLTCSSAGRAELRTPDGVEGAWDDPLEALQWMADVVAERNEPRVRWVGFLSYDLGRLFEELPTRAVDDLGLPLFRFSLQYDAFDVPRGLRHQASPAVIATPPPPLTTTPIRSTFTRVEYLAAVARAIDYVGAGDVFQVNLSQRFTVPQREHPAVTYARLRRRSPACYGACLCYDDFAILSNSPELFLRVDPPGEDGFRRILTRPIKGTRPRGEGMDAELRDSPKDAAELHMIVDLERNDLGRVCEIGSVRVTEPRRIEAHPTVYHGVATVEGRLRPDVTFAQLLRATFPGGSVTGAPKIRAMQIIDELEPVRRGPYCGAIGYLGGDGAVEFNVAIRTMIFNDGFVHVPSAAASWPTPNPRRSTRKRSSRPARCSTRWACGRLTCRAEPAAPRSVSGGLR
jgi:anthranilate/para-aminobenzoate synthase component I